MLQINKILTDALQTRRSYWKGLVIMKISDTTFLNNERSLFSFLNFSSNVFIFFSPQFLSMLTWADSLMSLKSITRSNILNGKIKRKDLKFASTNTSVSFLRPF